jgi:hypothetical protein
MKRAENKLPPNPDIKYSNPISTVIMKYNSIFSSILIKH